MKKRKIKTLLVSSLLMVLSGCDSISDPDITISQETITSFTINFPTNQKGFTVVGEKSVNQGEDYSFSLLIADGYDGDSAIVKANGTVLNKSLNNVYTIHNVQENINITVEGIIEKPYLKLNKSCFKYYLGHITEEKKTKAYFLDGVEASYDGKTANVDVDISLVDFSNTGTYEITYFIVGHKEINKTVQVVILNNPDLVSDVKIDISSIYQNQIVDKNLFGEVNLDFTLYNGDYLLNAEDVYNDSLRGGNFLSKSYLKSLSLGEYSFTVSFDEEIKQTFKLTLSDEIGPNYDFSVSNKDVCFTNGELVLPDVKTNEDSIQEIACQYSLSGVNKTKGEIEDEIKDINGDYSYKISILYNNKVVDEKEYNIHIRDNYIPFSFASSGGAFANKYYANNGNQVLSFDYQGGDTNVMLDESYIAANNTENKKYVFIAFRVKENNNSGAQLWNRDPEVCFDKDGNYVSVSVDGKYIGENIYQAGGLMYKIFALNKNKMENDVWIMRSFVGSIEIIKIQFCDLDYTDPIINVEKTRNKLADFISSFGNIWNYIHVALEGTSGGASLGGNCIDIQNSLFNDLKTAEYNGVRLTIKIKDRSDIKAMECWVYQENHISKNDAFVNGDGEFVVDIPYSLINERTSTSNNIMFYFNTTLESASNYDALRNDTSGKYVVSKDFLITNANFY